MSDNHKLISILIVIGFSTFLFGMGCNDNGDSALNTNSNPSDNADSESAIKIGEISYTITAVDYWYGTTVHGINDDGKIVGNGPEHEAYIFYQGIFTRSWTGSAYGINNLDQVVGGEPSCSCDYGSGMPFEMGGISALWNASGSVGRVINVPGSQTTYYEPPCDQCYYNSTDANGINDLSQIVGDFEDADGVTHGFLYSEGIYQPIDVPNAIGTTAWDINNGGQIVGSFVDAEGVTHGFLHSEGIYETIDVPNAESTIAFGINGAGQIVGSFVDAEGVTHGFLYSERIYMAIDMPNAIATFAADINSIGQIVGTFREEEASGIRGLRGYMLTPLN